MRYSIVIVLSAVGLAAATKNFTIDTSSVSLSTRSSWCAGQENTCSTLCASNPEANSCDPSTLDYDCLCHNGSAPGLEYYLQTMPTYICLEAYAECINDNPNNATGQSACTTDIKDYCGTLDASTADVSSGSPSSSASTSATATVSSPATVATSSTSAVTTASSSGGAMPTKMVHYGNGVAAMAVGLFAYVL